MQKIIVGHYLLQEQLGAGGMGTVYQGLDTENQQTVAVKQLHPNLTDQQLIERFKREGEALRELNHPNIVKMLDAVEENGNHYLIMEYISGADLAEHIKAGQMPLEEILNISIDLADALTRAHRLNIIHRDLKPANVLIAEDGTLRLTDFGVAHVGSKERVTDTDAVIGTIDYLPPEAFDSGTFDARGDIWAFGVMLFEMLTRERPFHGESIIQVIHAISSHPLPDLEELRLDIPTALIDLIYRMLERNLDARIQSVRQIGLELENILHGRAAHINLPNRFDVSESDIFAYKKHNLPIQTTAFVGRESELGELSKLITDSNIRLISILAPGGMGKTRLSLEASERALEHFADGVYFVELAPLSLSEQIIPAIAAAIDYKFQQGEGNAKLELFEYLRDKSILLVMDNFEHLLGGADIVKEILAQTNAVQILVTSRQRLALQNERVFHLGGMDFPEWETPEDALQYAAVKLFVNSAKRAKPDFELSTDNMDFVARICKLVQGMPLGIVLSGAWLEMLSPQEIASELEQSMDILSDEVGELPARQQSIRVVMAYAWEMMNEAEQAVFMALSVFKGGFTRESAQSVTGANLRILMSLVTKSLIRRDAETGRYEIHELLRQYAYEQLEASGKMNEVYEQHAVYFCDFLVQQLPLLKGGGQLKALAEIDEDYENCYAAWLWSVEHKKTELVDKMIDELYWYYVFYFQFDTGFQLFELARQQWPLESSEPIAGRLNARFIGTQDTQVAQPILEKCLALAEEYELLSEIAFCQRELGRLLGHHGDNKEQILTGINYLESSLKNYRQLEDVHLDAMLLDDIGYAYVVLGDFYKAITYIGRSLQLRKEVGDVIGYGECLNGYIAQLISTENIDKALPLLEEAREFAEQSNNAYLLNMVLSPMGVVYRLMGSFDKSFEIYETAYRLSFATKNERWRLTGLFGMVNALLLMDRDLDKVNQYVQDIPTDGALIYNDATVSFTRFSAISHYAAKTGDDDALYEQLMVQLNYIKYMGPYPPFIAFIPLYAYWEGRNKSVEKAVQWLAFSYEYQNSTSLPLYHNTWSVIVDFRESLRAELGEDTFDANWETGKLLDKQTIFEQIVEEFTES